jgi:hypothetical protein
MYASHDEELPQSIVFVARQVSLFLILAQEPFGRQVLSGGQALSIWRCFLNRMKFRWNIIGPARALKSHFVPQRLPDSIRARGLPSGSANGMVMGWWKN